MPSQLGFCGQGLKSGFFPQGLSRKADLFCVWRELRFTMEFSELTFDRHSDPATAARGDRCYAPAARATVDLFPASGVDQIPYGAPSMSSTRFAIHMPVGRTAGHPPGPERISVLS